MRLFIGLAIPESVASELENRARLASSRWSGSVRLTAAADLHVTLRFLGEMPAERVNVLQEVLEQARSRPLTASLTGVGVFRGAGAIFAEVQASPDLHRLQDAVSESLAWRGVPRELREFHPHVTLARRRHGLPQPELDHLNLTWSPIRVSLAELVLFQSVSAASEGGQRYQRLHEVRLDAEV